MPVKMPKRLVGYNQLRNYSGSVCMRETVEWLHTLHGDPIVGRRKREVRRELGLTSEDEEAKASEKAGLDLGELKAVIEDPATHGMPLAYLDGLSDMHFTGGNRTTHEDVVVIRFEVTGTHTAPLLGVPPTGRFVNFGGVIWLKFASEPTEDGNLVFKCTDYWAFWDLPAVAQEIGAAP